MQPPYAPPGPPGMYPQPPVGGPQWQPPSPPRKGPPAVLVALGALAIGGVCAAAIVAQQRQNDEFAPVLTACSGDGVHGARPFVAAQPHRLAGARMSGSGWTLDFFRVPTEMRASDLANTDVVACFGDSSPQTLETCEYTVYFRGRATPKSYPRTIDRLPVRFVAAATGQVLSQTTLQGPVPPACDSQGTSGSTPNAFHLQGAAVSSADVLAWLRSPAGQLP